MPSYGETTDRIKRIPIEPGITRAYWSKRRAWHGDRVNIVVETRHVPDGAKVVFEIWEDDSAEGSPDDFIAKLTGDHQIKDGSCTVDYEIAWDEESLGEELKTEGEEFEFYFLAVIDDWELRSKSNLMYVDLKGFPLSS